MNRSRHAASVLTALALLGLLLGTGTGAAKVSPAPKNRAAPRVSGSTVVGRRLSASHGRWTRSPRGYSYRWLRCNAAGKRCRKISGAKSARYLLRPRDLHARLRVTVRAWNRSGSGQATSRATGTVTEVVPPAPAPPAPPPPVPPAPPPPPAPPGRVVMTEDLGWAPVSPANLPWAEINQLILFNLATANGPGLDMSNIENINVPTWVATVHAHPGIKAIIAIGGAGNNNWPTACNNANRAQFVQNLIGFATSNGFDGVDMDIEDEYFFSHGPPNAVMTTCVNAIANAGHAAGLFVSADVITNWGGEWWAPSAGNIDQFNLMTFGSDLATMQDDVQHTIEQGLPPSKFVVGVDVSEHPQPSGGCAQFSHYAAQAGLMGSFVWEAHADYQRGNICVHGLASG